MYCPVENLFSPSPNYVWYTIISRERERERGGRDSSTLQRKFWRERNYVYQYFKLLENHKIIQMANKVALTPWTGPFFLSKHPPIDSESQSKLSHALLQSAGKD